MKVLTKDGKPILVDGKMICVDEVTQISDVTVNGDSIVVDGVAEIPIATGNTEGLVKIYPSCGTNIDTLNRLYVQRATEQEVTDKNQKYRPIVPFTADLAVKNGLVSSKESWSETEKASARGQLGVGSYRLVEDITCGEEHETQKLSQDIYFDATVDINSKLIFVINKGNGAIGSNNYISLYNDTVRLLNIIPCYFDSTQAVNYCIFEKLTDTVVKYTCFGTSNGYSVITKVGQLEGNLSDVTKAIVVANGTALLGSGTRIRVFTN